MYTLTLKQADDTMKEGHSRTGTKMSHPTKQKIKAKRIIHTSGKAKQLTHIYTKDDNTEKKRVQRCTEVEKS